MNEQLDKANQYASWFTAFLHDQPIVSALIIAIVGSWVLTGLARLWIARGPNYKRNVQTIDVVLAIGISLLLLHGQFGWRWILGLSLFIGGFSPFAYWMFAGGLCWKWPALRKYLSLREFAPEPDPEKEANINSGEGQ